MINPMKWRPLSIKVCRDFFNVLVRGKQGQLSEKKNEVDLALRKKKMVWIVASGLSRTWRGYISIITTTSQFLFESLPIFCFLGLKVFFTSLFVQ